MTFGMAAVLLILIIAGIILAVRGLQQRKNPLYNYHCTAVCVWVGPGSLHGIDDAFVDAVRSQPPV